MTALIEKHCKLACRELESYCRPVSKEPTYSKSVPTWEKAATAGVSALSLGRSISSYGPLYHLVSSYFSNSSAAFEVMGNLAVLSSSIFYQYLIYNREETKVGLEVFERYSSKISGKDLMSSAALDPAIKAFSEMERDRKYFDIGSAANGAKSQSCKWRCSVITGYRSNTTEAILSNLKVIRLWKDFSAKTVGKEAALKTLAELKQGVDRGTNLFELINAFEVHAKSQK